MTLNDILLTLMLSLGVPSTLRDEVVEDIMVVAEEAPINNDEGLTARLLAIWAWRESAYQTNAVGDGGRSLGVMQVNQWMLTAEERATVLKDRQDGLRAGLRVMHMMIEKCGSLRAGLGGYASGKCGGAPKLVAARCKLAGC